MDRQALVCGEQRSLASKKRAAGSWADAESRLDQPVAYCIAHQSGGRFDIELAHGGCPMSFDRLDTQVQNRTHLFVAVPFGDHLYDGALARRQLVRMMSVVLRKIGLQELFGQPSA